MVHGYIRLDVIEYLIYKKYIGKNELLEIFGELLENSGLYYNANDTILYFFDVLKDDITNCKMPLFPCILNGYDDDKKEEYVNKLLENESR